MEADTPWTVGSLFSGIGGMELGLERTGRFLTVWQAESDPYCRDVLRSHWPHTQLLESVENVDSSSVSGVEVVVGGFPCQPVSEQGHTKGVGDERWLWPEFARVVADLRPRYVLLENPTGLLTRGMGEVLGDLSRLGYDAEWADLSPCYLGAPHHRERVFVLAYPQRERRGRVHVEPRVFHSAAHEDWRQGEPARGERRRSWRSHPQRVLRPDKPPVGRVSDGFPRRLVRLRALGNAVVPQITEFIGRHLIRYEEESDA